MTTCDIIGCKEIGQRYYSDYYGYERYLCPRHKKEVIEKENMSNLLKC